MAELAAGRGRGFSPDVPGCGTKVPPTAPYRAFLGCATPQAWIDRALTEPELLLIDHAHCEKKAASTALNLMFRYPRLHQLQKRMSRLAREELRHFEQVLAVMERRGIGLDHLTPARYAGGLRELVATHEPLRLVDTLICGALIEARSCERFAALGPLMDDELAGFYRRLVRSEARHFEDYLELAGLAAPGIKLEDRIGLFRQREMELIESADPEFRFHSGVPT